MDKQIHKYLPDIAASQLFQGIDEESLSRLLETMKASLVDFEPGETLATYGDRVHEAGLLLRGRLASRYINADGLELTLSNLLPGDSVGLEFAWEGGRTSPLYLRAEEPGLMLYFDVNVAHKADVLDPAKLRLLHNIVYIYTQKTVELYHRVWIYGQKHIRSRLKIYLMSLERDADNVVVIPMKRSELAQYLGVDSSALSKELSRMREDGLIAVDRRRIRLLDDAFFIYSRETDR